MKIRTQLFSQNQKGYSKLKASFYFKKKILSFISVFFRCTFFYFANSISVILLCKQRQIWLFVGWLISSASMKNKPHTKRKFFPSLFRGCRPGHVAMKESEIVAVVVVIQEVIQPKYVPSNFMRRNVLHKGPGGKNLRLLYVLLLELANQRTEKLSSSFFMCLLHKVYTVQRFKKIILALVFCFRYCIASKAKDREIKFIILQIFVS